VREEGSKPSPAEDGEAEINEGRYVVMSANLGVVIVAGLSRQSFFNSLPNGRSPRQNRYRRCQVGLQPWIAHP
jgi:hypothetical protein